MMFAGEFQTNVTHGGIDSGKFSPKKKKKRKGQVCGNSLRLNKSLRS